MNLDLELADRFVRYLQRYARGEANAITAVHLCPALGLRATPQNRRQFRAAAHHAVESGTLVCSGQSGYWIPVSEHEARGTAARLRSEAIELQRRAADTERLAERLFSPPRDLFALLEDAS